MMLGRAALVLGSLLVRACCSNWAAGWGAARPPARLVEHHPRRAQATRTPAPARTKRDSELGFVTRPGFTGDGVTYDPHGHRLTPAPAGTVLAEPPVLAVGDSYAHGDEVSDAETWVALLQPLIGRRTVNAGVSGYGLDQIVLRAEKVARAEARRAGAGVHRRGPAAQRDEPRLGRREAVLRTGGRGAHAAQRPRPALAAAGRDARPLAAPVRLVGAGRHDPAPQGLAVRMVDRPCPRPAARRRRGHGLPLLKRLAGLGVPTLVVAEYDPYVWKNADYAREQRRRLGRRCSTAPAPRVSALDLVDAIDEAVKRDGYAAMFQVIAPRTARPPDRGGRIAEAPEAGLHAAAVVRRLAHDLDVVHVALAQARAGDAQELAVASASRLIVPLPV